MLSDQKRPRGGKRGPRVPKVPPGECVYLIGDSSGRMKIGRSRDADRRKSGLQTGASGTLRLIKTWACASNMSRILEACAHDALGWSRVSGEWFSCMEQEAASVIKAFAADDPDRAENLGYELAIRAEHAALLNKLDVVARSKTARPYAKAAEKAHIEALWPLYEAAHARCVSLGLPAAAHRS